jgi:hypothetical protein
MKMVCYLFGAVLYLASFMPLASPAHHYKGRLTLHNIALQATNRRITLMGRLRLVAALAALILAFMAFNATGLWLWVATATLAAVFLVLVRLYGRLQDAAELLRIRQNLIAGERQALAGNSNHFPPGRDYTDSNHPYSFDLDIFGEGSMYQLLCRATSLHGAQALAQALISPENDLAEILNRQAIIRELASQPLFLEDFRTAGLSAPEEPGDYELVNKWLAAPCYFINSTLAKGAIVMMPVVTIGLMAWAILIGSIHPATYLVVAVNWIVLGIFSKRIKSANAQVGRTARLVEKYQQLQKIVAEAAFTHKDLAAISAAAKGAAAQVVRFRKLANMFDSRNNNLAGPLMNSLFLFDIYCLLRLEGWRRAHRALLTLTMDAMVELDVLVGLANYAFNHPDNTYPSFSTGQELRAVNLRHPLLPDNAVGNDFSLGKDEKIYLLTGANMTGKSTFIRTVGTAALLSYLGVPVPADALYLPLMQIFTSIRVTDSVQNDVSYFRAELNRIKHMMDTVQAAGQLYLVLLDEPLRGTNSGDKQQGTRAIIENLLQQQVIGIVATHDIGLCNLQDTHPGMVRNYHFESSVTAEGLAFDFRLQKGGSTSNNATILMRQMGIIP